MNNQPKIAFHLGAPHTDDEQLTWSLRKDSTMLSERGVLLRRPKVYRRLISDRIADLQNRKSTPAGQERLLGSIVRQQNVDRLILSGSSFLGSPSWMLNGGEFYRNAGDNTARLRTIFPVETCEFYLAVRNPASFIPAVFQAQKGRDLDAFLGEMDLRQILWSDVLLGIQQANPDCPVTVWCNEDTPFIWSDILRSITAVDSSVQFSGEMDIINGIISKEGAQKLAEYFENKPLLDEQDRRKVQAEFLEQYYVEENVEEEIEMPGWTEELIEELTEIYEADIEKIETMSGVYFLTP